MILFWDSDLFHFSLVCVGVIWFKKISTFSWLAECYTELSAPKAFITYISIMKKLQPKRKFPPFVDQVPSQEVSLLFLLTYFVGSKGMVGLITRGALTLFLTSHWKGECYFLLVINAGQHKPRVLGWSNMAPFPSPLWLWNEDVRCKQSCDLNLTSTLW